MTKTSQKETAAEEHLYGLYAGSPKELVGVHKTLEDAAKARAELLLRMREGDPDMGYDPFFGDEQARREMCGLGFGEELLHGKN